MSDNLQAGPSPATLAKADVQEQLQKLFLKYDELAYWIQEPGCDLMAEAVLESAKALGVEIDISLAKIPSFYAR